MKCDICEIEFEPDEDDPMYEWRIKNGESVKACTDCLLFRSKEIERLIAKKNVN